MSKNKKRRPDDSRRNTSEKSDKQDRGKNVVMAKTDSKEGVDSKGDAQKEKKRSHSAFGSFRELVESVAIAFVLAFLVRTFEVEAFVIPTGSMATTLMGRHKDVTCSECGYPFTVSASEEVDPLTGNVKVDRNGKEIKDNLVHWATCPMCHFTQAVNQDKSFEGDRILVSKFDFQLDKPKRWDVTVFMYPEEAMTNFIKRLVGLPNETIKIARGDLHVKKEGESSFTIARKPPKTYLAMSRVVHDNDYSLPKTLADNGWPRRWWSPDVTAAWEASDDYRSFSTNGTADKEVVLRYYHYVPDQQAWKADRQRRPVPREDVLPQLVTDDCAYNSGVSDHSRKNGNEGEIGLHWVGDLGMECQLDVRQASGSMLFELIEGGRKMRCDIDLSDGTANLTISGVTFLATGKTPISKPGSYQIRFVNADDELRLWVDDELVTFDKPTTFEPLNNYIPTPADLAPVAILSKKADVTLSHLRILRDIYYIAESVEKQNGKITDFEMPSRVFDNSSEASIRHFYQSPELWHDAFAKGSLKEVPFQLKDKQYFMLGDNSPQSKDGRLWDKSEYYVDESLLKGKAMFIYWPHSWDKVKIGGVEIPFPFFPNYERMRFVR